MSSFIDVFISSLPGKGNTICVTLMTGSYTAGYKRIINTRWTYDAPEFSTAVWIKEQVLRSTVRLF